MDKSNHINQERESRTLKIEVEQNYINSVFQFIIEIMSVIHSTLSRYCIQRGIWNEMLMLYQYMHFHEWSAMTLPKIEKHEYTSVDSVVAVIGVVDIIFCTCTVHRFLLSFLLRFLFFLLASCSRHQLLP